MLKKPSKDLLVIDPIRFMAELSLALIYGQDERGQAFKRDATDFVDAMRTVMGSLVMACDEIGMQGTLREDETVDQWYVRIVDGAIQLRPEIINDTIWNARFNKLYTEEEK